ncbi:DUF1003 domain-containing protein [Aurantimonas sp. VKM B-3413]|uniref:DUF1003 domain-containing protein n=1 Tax=Aurantimonas sp. VKM B-3413 TaxID=2779401 RepID=UPI001E417E15|nr:DUF1003 domain-containing protein [Aurantimonas sp. VKM B-3413]MCB8837488.1 DUF1003 domain-containing protein [Aurantimonas sp. VKM B-3413]
MPHATKNESALRWFGRSFEILRPAEKRVLESAHDRRPIAADQNARISAGLSFGERLSDRIAEVGGSWGFIIGFLLFLILWAVANTLLLGRGSFDPYPFIFLNLILSMLAAIQAPVIMMSQNRAAARDRIEATHDYEVNLKAEIEILALHDKLDALRMMEIAALTRTIETVAHRLDRIESALGADRTEPTARPEEQQG